MPAFLSTNPYLVTALLVVVFFAATLPFAVVGLHSGGQLFLRCYEAYFRKRTSRRTPSWPALEVAPLSAYDHLVVWAGLRGRVPTFRAVLVVAITLALFGIIFAGISGFLTALFVVVAAWFWLRARATKQMTVFIMQLPDALTSLVDTLRSGFSLPQAMEFIARELTPPMQQTFEALVRAEAMNLNFSEALRRLSIQLQVPEWTVVAETLIAQQELGGNIIPLLEETAKALRDRLNVEQEILTMTAAGRMSGVFIGALIPIVLLFFFLVSPGYIGILLTTSIGRLLLLLAIGLEVAGFLWIRQITQIEY